MLIRFLTFLIPIIAVGSFLIGGLLYYESLSKVGASHNFLDATCKANKQSAHSAQYSSQVGTKGRKTEFCCDVEVTVSASDRPAFDASLSERNCHTPDFFSTNQPDACSDFFQSVECSEEAEECSFKCKYSPELLGSKDPICIVNSRNAVVCITGGVATPLEYFQVMEHDKLLLAYRPLYIALMTVPGVVLCIVCFVTSMLPSCNQGQYAAVPGGNLDKQSAPQSSAADPPDAARPPGRGAAAIAPPAGGGR
jgi:hypothetical protein